MIRRHQSIVAEYAVLLYLCAASAAFAHDPPGETLVDRTATGGAAPATCYLEDRISHDSNGNHQIIAGGVTPRGPCPKFYSTTVIDAKVSRLSRVADQGVQRSQQNARRLQELEMQLIEAIQRIETLTNELDTVTEQLRQTQNTVSTHREDFSKHNHDVNGEPSGSPQY